MNPELAPAGTLLDRVPPARGRLRGCVPLRDLTWFRVGGPAEVMFRPGDSEDLAQFLRSLPEEIPVTVLGVGSNLLVRDGGIEGVVVRLGGPFAQVAVEESVVVAGAGALDSNVALAAAERGLAGLEFLSGIPGTIGGALRMNAGAYGREMKDIVISAEAVDRAGEVHTLSPEELGFGYRVSQVPESWIFTRATLRGEPGERSAIATRMAEIRDARETSQPVRARTGGSTFKNPEPRKAWELVRDAGCAGLTRGAAQVSERHANFLINTGNAAAADLEALALEIAERVREASGVTLEWEIRRIGAPAGQGPADCAEAA